MSEKTELLGNCFICGAELGKVKMKNHVIKEHIHADNGEDTLLLKVEGAWDKEYWLLLDIAASAELDDLDYFIKRIWVECCGHMSVFSQGQNADEIPMEHPLNAFHPGDKLEYQYDMGDTTYLLVTVLAEGRRPKQKEAVRLLARNAAPEFVCAKCGKRATRIYLDDDEESPFYCEECRGKDDEECWLPVVNSPRMGVCGYCGTDDVWTFDPAKVR